MNFGYYKTGILPAPEEEQYKRMLLHAVQEERFIFFDNPLHVNPLEQYQLLLQLLREGDYLYLPCLECLGYTFPQIEKQWRRITEEIRADIIVLNSQGYLDSRKMRQSQADSLSAQDCFLFLLDYLPAMQQNWQKRKKATGRPRFPFDELLFHETVMRWLKKEIPAEKASAIMGCSRATWYKYTKERGYFLKKKHVSSPQTDSSSV